MSPWFPSSIWLPGCACNTSGGSTYRRLKIISWITSFSYSGLCSKTSSTLTKSLVVWKGPVPSLVYFVFASYFSPCQRFFPFSVRQSFVFFLSLPQFASVCSPLTDLSLISSFFRDFSSPDLLRAPCFFSLTCLEHLVFFSDLLRAPCVAMIYWRKMGTVSDNWQLVGQQRLYCSGVLKRCLIQ